MADVYTIIATFSQSFPGISRLVTGGAYIIGLVLIVGAIYKLRIFGESRMMMGSGQTDVKGPLLSLIVGTLLIYLPTTFTVAEMTVLGTTSPLAYPTAGTEFSDIKEIGYNLMKIIGLIAFIRGLLLINRSTDAQAAQQGTLAKGITHLVGGLLAYHLYFFFQILENTFGISF